MFDERVAPVGSLSVAEVDGVNDAAVFAVRAAAAGGLSVAAVDGVNVEGETVAAEGGVCGSSWR